MEEHQKQHITDNIWKLLQWTTCSLSCITVLIQEKVLAIEDVQELESMSTPLKKSEKLYEILFTKKDSYQHLISALEEGRQTGALDILRKLENDEKNANYYLGNKRTATEAAPPAKRTKLDKAPVRFDVYNPVSNFTGREPQLSELHQKLQDKMEKREGNCQMASIVGLGGIGKTELARKYNQEYGEEFYDGNVVWISAQTEESLGESFRRLASDHLKIILTNVNQKEMDITSIVDEIYTFFNNQKVIFIFDNAERPECLRKLMPFRLSSSSSGSIHILITSRDRECALGYPILELDELTEQDAASFVKESLKIENDSDDEAVFRLVNRLQRFPLALSQAVSFITQRRLLSNFTVSQYLERFESNFEKLLDHKRPSAEFNSYTETTLTTWRITTQQISANKQSGRGAMEILNSISYFLPDNIPFSMFSSLSEKGEFEEALLLLVKYTMVKVHREKKTFSVHRLFQGVTRIQLNKNNEEEKAIDIAFQFIYTCVVPNLEFGVDIVKQEFEPIFNETFQNCLELKNIMEKYGDGPLDFLKLDLASQTPFIAFNVRMQRRLLKRCKPLWQLLINCFTNGINLLGHFIYLRKIQEDVAAMCENIQSKFAIFIETGDYESLLEILNFPIDFLDEPGCLGIIYKALEDRESQETLLFQRLVIFAVLYLTCRSDETFDFFKDINIGFDKMPVLPFETYFELQLTRYREFLEMFTKSSSNSTP